jgi:hypothetical protein
MPVKRISVAVLAAALSSLGVHAAPNEAPVAHLPIKNSQQAALYPVIELADGQTGPDFNGAVTTTSGGRVRFRAVNWDSSMTYSVTSDVYTTANPSRTKVYMPLRIPGMTFNTVQENGVVWGELSGVPAVSGTSTYKVRMVASNNAGTAVGVLALEIIAPPVFVDGQSIPHAKVNAPYDYTVLTNNGPNTFTWPNGEQVLPGITGDTMGRMTGILGPIDESGKPIKAGPHSVSLNISNPAGPIAKTITIVVDP